MRRDRMTKTELEKLYDELESIEASKSEIDLTLLESEIMEKVYDELVLNEPHSREKVEWSLKVNDYFNWVNKVALVAEHNKKVLEKGLEDIKAEIDAITGKEK